jgi:phosphatidylglycerophosphatase C
MANSKKTSTHKEKFLVAFDMDGTLTKGDSFWRFLAFVSDFAFLTQIILKKPFLTLAGLLLPQRFAHTTKEYLVEGTIKGKTQQELKTISKLFVTNKMIPRFKKEILPIIEFHKSHGHCLILVTASLDIYSKELAALLGFNDVLATAIQFDSSGIATGKFENKNNRGIEKANSLKYYIEKNKLNDFFIIAYGNSANDDEMLRFADIGFRVDKLNSDLILKTLKQAITTNAFLKP